MQTRSYGLDNEIAKVKDDENDDTNGMSKASILKDPYIVKLMKAEEALTSISNKVSALTSEVVSFMDLKRDRRNQRLLRWGRPDRRKGDAAEWNEAGHVRCGQAHDHRHKLSTVDTSHVFDI